MAETIPAPTALPIIGNLLDIRHVEGPLMALEHLADTYGGVYRLSLAGRKIVVISSAELLIQFTDEKQFVKTPPVALDDADFREARGLFTARSDDPDWGQAHRVLMPAFGPLPVEDMFQGMKDIAYQLVLKWARQEEGREILLTDDYTRLTLDTIAICAMDYRFNSFYSDAMHPFVDAMTSVLTFQQTKSSRPAIVNRLIGSGEAAKAKEDAATMDRIAKEVIDRRRANPTEKNDLLNTMLLSKDPKTGATMRDELIMANMITFLIAGHETTSGLLSFAFMNLLHNPRTYLAAQKEVDAVIGTGVIEIKHLKQLKYLNAVLRETLRLTPTAPAISKIVPASRHNEYVSICDGKYRIENDDIVRLLLGKAMRDPLYFGDDAHEFRPERMHEDDSNYDRLMKAWKPFGNGSRSCIGQSFAWQEALLVTALAIQNFDMTFVDPGYKMHIKQTLTVKPKDLLVKIRLREGLDATKLDQRLHNRTDIAMSKVSVNLHSKNDANHDTKGIVQIYYGSNSGTCKALAQKLTSSLATKLGMKAEVLELDAAVKNLSVNRPNVIITSSYEGQPPDNAARFITWLEDSELKDLQNTKYAVFGCGHKDWHNTLHRIPKLVDEKLESRGATKLIPLGTSDVSQGTVLDDFELWQSKLMENLEGEGRVCYSNQHAKVAEVSIDRRAQELSSGLSPGKVKHVKVLTSSDQPEKRHIEVELPAGSAYEAGDYLCVLPLNPDGLVLRIMKHWALPRDATITFQSSIFSSLAVGIPFSVHELLKGYFELSQPFTKNDLRDARGFTTDSDTLKKLDEIITDASPLRRSILEAHTSLFDLLERYKTIDMPFVTYLSSLLPLRIRQYSISSSPISNPLTCTITYSIIRHKGTSTDGDLDQIHEGVASTYLSTLSPGDTLQVAVKRTATANSPCPFRLPNADEQASTPLLMFCAGAGLAPFRGFIQQRAKILEQDHSYQLAPAILFVGCRNSEGDRLYAEELNAWQKIGAVDVRYSFSQEPQHKLAKGCKYIGDRIFKDKEDIRALWKKGARGYTCGSRKIQENVNSSVMRIFDDVAKQEQWDAVTREEKQQAFKQALSQRGVSDVFD